MRAVVFHGPRDMRVENVPDASLREPTDVVVRVERTAICGSDLHLWHSEGWEERAAEAERGFVVGHEFLGTIEDVGAEVRRFRRGDRVLVACTTGCGDCASCRGSVYSGCRVMTGELSRVNVFGFSNQLWGGQAEAVRVPYADTNCFALPSDLDDEQALFLTDILPTGYLGADMAEVGPGDTVVVFGSGPVGVFAQLCAQVRGAARIVVVDLDGHRLAEAEKRGCIAVDPARQDVLQTVLELTDGVGAEAAIEAVGSVELIHQAAMVTRPGGRVAVIGVLGRPYEIQWPLFFVKNLTLRTGLVSPQVYIPRLLPLIREGRIDPRQIISHRLGLDQATRGYELFAGHLENATKVVLTP